MLKNSFIVILLLMQSLAFASERKVLKVSGPPNYLPMSFVEKTNGKPAGVSYDLVRILGKKLGIPIEISANLPWRRVLLYLDTGKLDMTVAIYRTIDREKKYNFSIPYHKNAAHIFVKHDRSFDFQGLEDLVGKTGDVPMGASFGIVFDTFVTERNLRIEYVPSKDQRFKKLLLGRSDYLIQDKLDGIMYIRKNLLSEEVVMLPKAISFTDVHFAISKHSPYVKLMPEINTVLEELKQNGTISSLIKKYVEN